MGAAFCTSTTGISLDTSKFNFFVFPELGILPNLTFSFSQNLGFGKLRALVLWRVGGGRWDFFGYFQISRGLENPKPQVERDDATPNAASCAPLRSTIRNLKL